jgi:hypothetical protein
VERVIVAVLRSRAHRLLSGRLCLLTVAAGAAPRSVTIPVRYVALHDRQLAAVPRSEAAEWWRDLLRGAPVQVRLRGHDRRAVAHALVQPTHVKASTMAGYHRRYPDAGGDVVVLIDLC